MTARRARRPKAVAARMRSQVSAEMRRVSGSPIHFCGGRRNSCGGLPPAASVVTRQAMEGKVCRMANSSSRVGLPGSF